MSDERAAVFFFSSLAFSSCSKGGRSTICRKYFPPRDRSKLSPQTPLRQGLTTEVAFLRSSRVGRSASWRKWGKRGRSRKSFLVFCFLKTEKEELRKVREFVLSFASSKKALIEPRQSPVGLFCPTREREKEREREKGGADFLSVFSNSSSALSLSLQPPPLPHPRLSKLPIPTQKESDCPRLSSGDLGRAKKRLERLEKCSAEEHFGRKERKKTWVAGVEEKKFNSKLDRGPLHSPTFSFFLSIFLSPSTLLARTNFHPF